jgi:hypothetical protein
MEPFVDTMKVTGRASTQQPDAGGTARVGGNGNRTPSRRAKANDGDRGSATSIRSKFTLLRGPCPPSPGRASLDVL